MVADLRGSSALDQLSYYVRGQAPGLADYCLQGALTTLLGWVPGLPGIAARGVAYRLMLSARGFPAIEGGVRIRHARNLRLGSGVFLDRGVYLHACPGGIEIGDGSAVMHNAELHVFNFRDLPHAFIKLGKGCFVGESVVIRGQGGVTIGDYVLLAPQAKILAVDHNFLDPTRPVIDQGISGRGITIEDGAWIGAGAAVLDGVRVGRGAVVGANAVVTRDVPARTVAVGSPARVVRRIDIDRAASIEELDRLLGAGTRGRSSAMAARSFPDSPLGVEGVRE